MKKILILSLLIGLTNCANKTNNTDLTRTDLIKLIAVNDSLNLRGINLNYMDLSYLNLTGANLSYALLFKSNLKGANLKGANLFAS